MEIVNRLKQIIMSSCYGITRLFSRKKAEKHQIPPIQMAMLSGSIRRVK